MTMMGAWFMTQDFDRRHCRPPQNYLNNLSFLSLHPIESSGLLFRQAARHPCNEGKKFCS
jgi:hypothetical protein